MATVDVESRTQEIGRRLLEAADGYRPGPAERVQDWLLTHAVADDRFPLCQAVVRHPVPDN